MTTIALPSSTFSDGDYSFLDNKSIIQDIVPSIDTTIYPSAFTTLSDSDDDSFGHAVFPPKNKLKMFLLGFVDSDATTDDNASDDEGSLSEDDLDDYEQSHLKKNMAWVLEDLMDYVERKKCIEALALLTLHYNTAEEQEESQQEDYEPNKLDREVNFMKAMLKICLVGTD
jgi:hypothetical protein